MGIGKYQITELKKFKADYRNVIGDARKDELRDQILKVIVMDKRYLEKDFSASQLAAEIGTNSRYISAVMADRFHTNFNGLVNMYRINDAMTLLAEEEHRDKSIEEIGAMVGFATRQAFYASFFRFQNTTPREYRLHHLPPAKANARRRRKKAEAA